MKILFVDNGSANRNAVALNTRKLMNILSAHGHQLAHCCFSNLFNAPELKKTLKIFAPDFIHVANVNPLFSTIFFSTIKDHSAPLILDCDSLTRNAMGKWMTSILPGVDLFLVGNELNRQILINQGLAPGRIGVLDEDVPEEELYINLVNVYFQALTLSMRRR